MREKLQDYQVIGVVCGGALYQVRHKVTGNEYAWKPHDCSALADHQLLSIDNEVQIVSEVACGGNLVRHYATVLHRPTGTLYFVLEHNGWRALAELVAQCGRTDAHFAEAFLWRLLLELARAAHAVENLHFTFLTKRITSESIFVGESGELRINCFDLCSGAQCTSLMQQIGELMRLLCRLSGACDDKIKEIHYSDELRDIIRFLTDERHTDLRADVLLYHPTVLANTDTMTPSKHLSDIVVSLDTVLYSDTNKCDSEKAVEQYRMIEPLPRSHINHMESPLYCNISPKWKVKEEIEEYKSPLQAVSPTIAALALELPGYVPRSRQPYSEILQVSSGPQQLSEDTLSQQWMSRLIALRQREESLNKRERDIIAKEIINSPCTKIVTLANSPENSNLRSNGITLPPVIDQIDEVNSWVSRRRHRRSCSVRPKPRRKSYAYEDLDSSLSADNGDGSMIVTAARITKDNMPRKLFSDVSAKKVHFTASNPFIESDESVTFTFYELEDVDKNKEKEMDTKDITKFKYLDLDKVTLDKRSAKQWSQSSPSKQARLTEKVFTDITNTNLHKTLSKTSISSRGSNFSRNSIRSSNMWSCVVGKGSENLDKKKMCNKMYVPTPTAPPELKKSKRKSLLPFKTPFKFKTSTKV